MYTVVEFDTPTLIARKLTRNGARATELVMANPQKARQLVRGRPTFKTLAIGEKLLIPAAWKRFRGLGQDPIDQAAQQAIDQIIQQQLDNLPPGSGGSGGGGGGTLPEQSAAMNLANTAASGVGCNDSTLMADTLAFQQAANASGISQSALGHNLSEDGFYGPETASVLGAVLQALGSSTTAPAALCGSAPTPTPTPTPGGGGGGGVTPVVLNNGSGGTGTSTTVLILGGLAAVAGLGAAAYLLTRPTSGGASHTMTHTTARRSPRRRRR